MATKKSEPKYLVDVIVDGADSEVQVAPTAAVIEACGAEQYQRCRFRGTTKCCATHHTSFEFSFTDFPSCCGMSILHNLGELHQLPDEATKDTVIKQVQNRSETATIIATEVVGIRDGNKPPDIQFLLRNGFLEVYRFYNPNSGNTVGVFVWDEGRGRL